MHFVIVSSIFASTGVQYPTTKLAGSQLSKHFIHIIFLKENFFEVGNKANPPRLSVIFPKSYLIRKHRIYNTVRNEIRRIDNFEREIRRKGKKYKLNSQIHASRHYHKGNRDQAGFLYELFYFPSTSKSPRESSANLQMLIWWCHVACDKSRRLAYSWPEFYWCLYMIVLLIRYLLTFIVNF